MSRIGLADEPNPLSHPEHPISPTRDRATVIEAMGGRKNAAPLFIAFAVILLILIGGATMLGIGIVYSPLKNYKAEKHFRHKQSCSESSMWFDRHNNNKSAG